MEFYNFRQGEGCLENSADGCGVSDRTLPIGSLWLVLFMMEVKAGEDILPCSEPRSQVGTYSQLAPHEDTQRCCHLCQSIKVGRENHLDLDSHLSLWKTEDRLCDRRNKGET